MERLSARGVPLRPLRCWRVPPLAMPLTGCAHLCVQVISSAGTQELGRSLTSHELENLSEEQKMQVLKIAEETVKAAPDST